LVAMRGSMCEEKKMGFEYKEKQGNMDNTKW
jgi:hypothetical protein